ncbi:MAG: tRNA (guanosine(46)-N7)-methyltransferase TrmB [Deferribacterales bacterium]|nr:tRNA (guanosine(46)-N7)-methyltransferase TrmB [Deferribacterales bacterium]
MPETHQGKPPVLVGWWQGGQRYIDNISPEGKELNMPFDGVALYGSCIWEQLEFDIKLKPIDFNLFFENNLPLNFEIGIGNGEFLAKYAADTPNENWLGVEVFKKSFTQAAKRAVRMGLTNVRLIQFDAALILRLIPDNTLNSVYVNFPDPWPKSKHKRRRLLKTHFIELIVSKLKKGGILNIATDHDDYAAEIVENISPVKGISSLFGNDVYRREPGNYFPTKYYKKFAENSGAYFFKYIKG